MRGLVFALAVAGCTVTDVPDACLNASGNCVRLDIDSNSAGAIDRLRFDLEGPVVKSGDVSISTLITALNRPTAMNVPRMRLVSRRVVEWSCGVSCIAEGLPQGP